MKTTNHLTFALVGVCIRTFAGEAVYPIVDTGQARCYNAEREIAYPAPGDAFHGQDAQYRGCEPAYCDHGDGTVTDERTGLMWVRDPGEKMSLAEAEAGAKNNRTGGYDDWRLPTIKELYSLIDFRGSEPEPDGSAPDGARPFIDTHVFVFHYGSPEAGERVIDSRCASSTRYKGTTMGGAETVFGVNFADGRIKGYPARSAAFFYALYVRGHRAYGHNRLIDNRDGTVTDQATGLIWQQADSGRGMDWEDALAYAESLQLGGHDDWRLPNAKELQSLVDYARSPDATGSAAIDPVFACSAIVNEAHRMDWPFYWTGTTHRGADGRCDAAVYIAFGRAMGCMRGRWLDVHGAGAQRSDPKTGDPSAYPCGRGPQGDAIRIRNHVRCVRGGLAEPVDTGPDVKASSKALAEYGACRLRQTMSPFADATLGQNAIGRPPPSFVSRLDRDGDHRVSRDEFDGPPGHFDRLDRDGGGYLEEDEAPPPRRPLERGGK